MKKLLLILLCLPLLFTTCKKEEDTPTTSGNNNGNSSIYTYVPDDNFEIALINLGLDNTLNDTVLTAAIDTVYSLNVGGQSISDLTGLEAFTALATLRSGYNQLTSLDVSNNLALTELYCENNQLTSLDVSQNTALFHLWCYDNQLTTLDVSANTALTYLACGCINKGCGDGGNQLTSLDVSNNTDLIELWCNNNQLTSLDVSNNTDLIELWCNNNQLTSLDVRNGNNIDMYLSAGNNTSLYCIDVDNETWSNTANWHIPSQSFFSEDCGVKTID
jgi:hypothetical protein